MLYGSMSPTTPMTVYQYRVKISSTVRLRAQNRLAPHMQWIFVAASKNYGEEAEESKNSGLGQLLARTVRSKVDFSDKISELRERIQSDYQTMLDAEQSVLEELSKSLQENLQAWSHPDTTAQILWRQDPDRSVRVEEPWAHIRLGERGFESELSRFGHGLQRSYLLTLLHELSRIEAESAPTLIMGIEEPELYQHPPQARHLAEVLHTLSQSGAQIMCCSHSPLFVPGDDFESIRIVRETGSPSRSVVTQVQYSKIADSLDAVGKKLHTEAGMLAKLYPTLNPVVSEMFFCGLLILVEGPEDVAYLSTYIELCGRMADFRKQGGHIVPVGGKNELAKAIAIANELGILTYVVCDGDTNETNPGQIKANKVENLAIQKLTDVSDPKEWPTETVSDARVTVWCTSLTDVINQELGETWEECRTKAREYYGNASNLAKNPLAIARALELAWEKGCKSQELLEVVERILTLTGDPATN